MLLTGVVDAAVAGGIENYRKAFFEAEYLKENPTESDRVDALKEALRTHLNVLEVALDVHGKLCPAEMRALQVHIPSYLLLVGNLSFIQI
tara:strand:+ start:406 stop:675 length:270 start_codon:yes stop_codon:yes gene_type:complete